MVVQLVRIRACHARGRGFESRPYRKRLFIDIVLRCFAHIFYTKNLVGIKSGITELQTANSNLQKDLTNLKKAVDNNSVSQGEYAKSAAATKVAIQQNNETIRLYQKEIRNVDIKKQHFITASVSMFPFVCK